MKRIIIFGRSGSGKSSLAAHLGRKLKLPIFHLDKLFWLPGWVERSKSEMAVDVEKILATHDSWVIDGNYKKVALESRIKSSDQIIILDLDPFTCIYRILKRNCIHWNKTRPDMGEGCNAKFDWEFAKYIWNYKNRTQKPIEAVLSQYPEKKILKFKNQRQLNSWLKNL